MKKQFSKLSLFFLLFSLFAADAAPTHPTPNKDGLISYVERGQGEPLVLIHAFPLDQRMWEPQKEALSKYFRVIAVDLYGFGTSPKTNGKVVTMAEYADQVKKLLDYLQIKKAIIGGESMGGYVTLAFLAKYPHSASGAILANTQSIPDSAETKVKREEAINEVLQNGTPKYVASFMPKIFTDTVSPQISDFIKKIAEQQSPLGIVSALRGMMMRENTSSILPTLNIPILIITGDQDQIISPRQSEYMHSLAKYSKLIVIQKAGHLSNLEQAARWNAAVTDRFYKPETP